MRVTAAVALVVILAGCTSTTAEKSTSTTAVRVETPVPTEAPAATGESPDDIAGAYALEKSGGVTTGCSSAARGAESEGNAGCIYTVSFAGCYEGLTGEQLGPFKVEEEFDQEPALVERYNQAVIDCTP